MVYHFREIQKQDELLNWFQLRYQIYNSTRCAGFLSDNAREIDVDAFDTRARHYGLFAQEENKEVLIGGLRIIENRPVLTSIKALHALGLLGLSTSTEEALLPIFNYFPEEADFSFADILLGKRKITEGSRLILKKEYQSLRLAKFIISNAIVMHMITPDEWVAFVSCNPLHTRLYHSFGFQDVSDQTTWAKEAPVSALYLNDKVLHADKRQELDLMAAHYVSKGYSFYQHQRTTVKQPIRRSA